MTEPAKHPSVEILCIVLGLAIVGIAWMVVYGVPTNALHVSITSGCFGAVYAVIFAFGAPNIIGVWKQ